MTCTKSRRTCSEKMRPPLKYNLLHFMDAFAELRKATISFSVSVRRSVRVKKKLSSHWTDFHIIWYLISFRKSVEKIHVSLNSDNKTGTLHENLYTLRIMPRSFRPRVRNVSDGSCRENQDTHSLFNIFFFV